MSRAHIPAMAAAVLVAGCASGGPAGRPAGTAPPAAAMDAYPVADSAAAVHLLNRLTFGPRPGDIALVQRVGVAGWLEQQLGARRGDDPAERLVRERYPLAFLPPAELYERFPPAAQVRRAAERMGDSAARRPPQGGPRALGGEVAMATLTRHALSEHQVREVMSDFWFNHFNVFMGKQAARWTTADYIERAIRPNALGRFEDLLVAVARHPAMLVYLDNAQSVAPGSRPPRPPLAGRGARRRMVDPQQEERLRALQERMPTGLNENYARELLELHTLGVDGGYAQADVQEVARILTGWSVTGPGPLAGGAGRRGAPDRILTFEFRPWAHDRGEKVVLGERFPAGGGEEEGRRLLRLLAAHPATARHLAHKLCARFVAADPPDGCVDQAVAAYQRSGGEIRAVLRAIVASEDFWATANRRTKMKSPLEFVVSAMRATGAVPDSTPRLAGLLQQLGQPLFGQQVPTGYPETLEEWVNSGALLNRMNVALGLASGRGGVVADLDALVPPAGEPDALVARVNAIVLGGQGSSNTLRVLREQIADIREPRQARTMVVALALGSPDFQRQ